MSVARVLVVLGELFEENDKNYLLRDLESGFSTCPSSLLGIILERLNDLNSIQCDSNDEFFTFKTSDLTVTALCCPSPLKLAASIGDLLTPPKESEVVLNAAIIYAGILSEGAGHWLMRDYIFDPTAFSDRIQSLISLHSKQADVENKTLKPIFLHIGIGAIPSGGDWRQLVGTQSQLLNGRALSVSVNRSPSGANKGKEPNVATDVPSVPLKIGPFLSHLVAQAPKPYCPHDDQFFSVRTIGDPTLKVSKPCLYLFPEGSGHAAILALPGYNMLINGGCAYKPNFWAVANYLEKIDSILVTHWGLDNILGFKSVLPIAFAPTSHQSALCLLTPPPNLLPGAKLSSNTHQSSPLCLNLPLQLTNLMNHLKQSGIQLSQYTMTRATKLAVAPKPIQIYQKIGQGSLDLFALTPTDDDSTELRKLTDDWSKAATSLLTTSVLLGKSAPGNKFSVPLLSHMSLSALVVWRPTKNTEPILRFLFVSPNAHQARVLTSLEALITSYIFLRHAKASTSELERKRPVQHSIAKRQTIINNGGSKLASGTMRPTSQPLEKEASEKPFPGSSSKTAVMRKHSDALSSNKSCSAVKSNIVANPASTEFPEIPPFGDYVHVASDVPIQQEVISNQNGFTNDLLDYGQAESNHVPFDEGVFDQNNVQKHPTDDHSELADTISSTDAIADWGTPQGLPAPPPPGSNLISKRVSQTAPSASVGLKKISRPSICRPNSTSTTSLLTTTFQPGYSVASAHAAGPGSTKLAPYDKVKPIYVDVAFIPGGGNPHLVDAEWFKRVRARFYVATDPVPTCSLLDALTVGKESWTGDDAQLTASLVLAYENEDILVWLGRNAGRINNCHLNVAAVASRSKIQLMTESTAGSVTAAINNPGYRIDF